MSETMRCVFCGRVLFGRPFACCGEVDNVEPLDVDDLRALLEQRRAAKPSVTERRESE